jgi:hypothetical protein
MAMAGALRWPTGARAQLADDRRLAAIAERFADGDRWFQTSPLYQVLARTVATDTALLELAAEARPGQQAGNMLMGAAHLLVLRDPTLPLARFYPSAVGDRAEPPDAAGPEFAAFCAEHRETLADIVRTRLVQTNVPARGVSVRLAMHHVAQRVDGPVTFVEVGASAGIQLRFDRWVVETGGRRFGPHDASLVLQSEWRAASPPPDLDRLPPIRERLGIDLHPVDATDPDERLWLKALVWPEHRDRLAELDAALDVVAADPPEIVAGDAIDLLPRLDAERLPADLPLVVFHAMVAVHVPAQAQQAFRAAIQGLAARRRLFHVSLEMPPRDDFNGHLLRLEDSEGPDQDLAAAQGHGRWIRPLPAARAA